MSVFVCVCMVAIDKTPDNHTAFSDMFLPQFVPLQHLFIFGFISTQALKKRDRCCQIFFIHQLMPKHFHICMLFIEWILCIPIYM